MNTHGKILLKWKEIVIYFLRRVDSLEIGSKRILYDA